MLKLLFIILLLLSPVLGLSQFNTVRQAKALPLVLIDTVAERSHATMPKTVNSLRRGASMPMTSLLINSPYGERLDPVSGELRYHRGIDFSASQDSVLAILPGKVNKVGYSKGLGNYIEVEHGTYRSVYGHLSVILVRESQEVPAGAVIAITGSTGRSTGEHLHFAIKRRGMTVDPTPYLDLIYRMTERRPRSPHPLSSLQ